MDIDDVLEARLAERDSTELLDEGYELLERFRLWLARQPGEDDRSVPADYANAEAYLEYLCTVGNKSASDADEFDLRWFVYHHYIRTSPSDEYQAVRLLHSLLRFYEFIRLEKPAAPAPWLDAIFSADALFEDRRGRYNRIQAGEPSAAAILYTQWSSELVDDLDHRVLWLPRELSDDLFWGEEMGWREGTLRSEATVRWRTLRAMLMQDGRPAELLRDELVNDYQTWLNTPQGRLENSTPMETILAEREERSELPDQRPEEDA